MNRNKIEYASIYMGVDTIQIKSKTAIEFDSDLYPFIHADIVRKSDGSYSYYILNPDKAYQTSIYNSTDYNNSLNYMLDSIALDEPIKSRVDFRFDSFDDNYNELLKLNKLVVLLIANKYKITNRYQSYDPLTNEALTIRIQSKYIEAENYNKGLQEPDGLIKNRLELRSKSLTADIAENEKEFREFEKWCVRLDKAITVDNFNDLISRINISLADRFKDWSKLKGHTLSNFITQYENCIFTSRQLENLLTLLNEKGLTSISNCKESAKKYKKRYGLEFFSLNDLNAYKVKLIESGAGFFEM